MPMGLNISPVVWQSYINAILSCLSSKKYCEAIMDDLLLFTPNKQSHFEKLEDLLKALCKHGLKISPKKCQLFKTELQYMANTIFIKDKRVCMKPLRSRLEAIQRLKPPVTPKECNSFAGMVNFVSMFCPELQKLLKPIYDLTKKGRPFLWGKEQQDAFEEIKSRMQNPPVLSMPNRKGRFILYSDTSKLATGSVLYQFQDGKPRLSKRMPEAAKNYSITELEMCGLAINIATFSHLLRKVDFDAVVDHLAIMHIMKSRMEPATNRIKRLLEVLSSYSFNLYYIKGKDMVLSDFLSRQLGDKSDPHQIIPISFNIKEVLKESCQNNPKATFMVQTRSQTKGVKAPVAKRSPNSINKRVQEIKLIIIDDEKDTPNTAKTNYPTSTDVKLHTKHPQNQTYPQLVIRPPPRLPDPLEPTPKVNTGIEPNLDFEENSTHQEGIITETYESPDKSYLEQPQELTDLVDSTKLIHKYLPKQVDIDRIMGIIKEKCLRALTYHWPLKRYK